MTLYKYTALKNNNMTVYGEIEAASLRDARSKIRALGFIPTKVYDENLQENSNSIELTKNGQKNKINNIKFLNLSQKIAFTSELQILISSGVSIIEALHSIEINTPYRKLAIISRNLSDCLKSGLNFSQSMQIMYKDVFGSVYMSLIKAGEDSGELDLALERLTLLLRKQDNLKGKIISASIYPAILIVIILGLLISFAKFVFPIMTGIITMNGGEVTGLAKSMVDFFSFIENYWWLILLSIGGFAFVVNSVLKDSVIKSVWDNFIIDVPVISDLVKYINLSNFMVVLQISYEAGLPIIFGLDLAKNTVGNINIKNKIIKTVDIIKQGKTLTEAFQYTGVVPNTFVSIISAGEKSGNLGKMFKDCSDVIDKKLDIVLNVIAKMFEPGIIIVIGVVVAIIVVAFIQMFAGLTSSLI